MSIHPADVVEARTRSVEETRTLAGSVAGVARAGDLILLSGDLGAGKTAFVQGFGEALGVGDPITSPTFALAQRYEGKLVVHHLDVYRLTQLHEVYELGVPEMLDEGGVVLVEWGDAVLPVLPSGHLEVKLAYGTGTDDRQVSCRAVGSAWQARQRVLAEALVPWRADGSAGPERPARPVGGEAGDDYEE